MRLAAVNRRMENAQTLYLNIKTCLTNYRTVIVVVVLLVISLNAKAQLARDFLCTDATKVLVYSDKQGNKESLRFAKMFVYEGVDTIYLYQRIRLNGSGKGSVDTLMRRANGNKLFISMYLWNGYIDKTEPNGQMITIVEPGKVVEGSETNNFDMSSTTFETTTTYLPTYTLPNGLKFKDVIMFDQFNRTDNFHYITYVAKGEGLIDQGDGETRRAKK